MMVENGWKDTDPRISLSLAVSFGVVVFFWILAIRLNKRKKLNKQKAIERGHIIKAKRVGCYESSNPDGDETYHYVGQYEYVVNGKTKRKTIRTSRYVHTLYLDLYYVDDPKKVFSDYDDAGWLFSCAILLGIVTCILMLYLTGYFAGP